MKTRTKEKTGFEKVLDAQSSLKGIAVHTPLQYSAGLSEKYNAQVYLKREDLQLVRSYKLRGAYYKIASLGDAEKRRGIVCASAGNHAQGVAFSCRKLKIPARVFMPVTTPQQKVKQVKYFGKEFAELVLTGDTFDDAYAEAARFAAKENRSFIHPFDDEEIIAGQGTVALEILEDAETVPDFVFVPVGGGGLAAGMSLVFKNVCPQVKLIGVQPAGAPSMKRSLEAGRVVELPFIEKFVDGASVRKPGEKTFSICRKSFSDFLLPHEGAVCSAMLRMYNEEAIVLEPAGALTIAALDLYRGPIRGKKVVCILSGGNNDIGRMEEIKERALLHEELKHYFLVHFPQRAGALREFVNEVLGPGDNITYFQYAKKTNRENGPAVIGIELCEPGDFALLTERMKNRNVLFEHLNAREDLLALLV
ncbi:MAG: threonine dehydratase [Bacteroidetes bacterium]|nr:MAG: threonine dehydratase [Bacteroidota bacterium]